MTLEEMAAFDHEQVNYFHDEETGLKCIIGIYNTNLGAALGGTRIWDYDTEKDALKDVLRLSKGMAYKAAAADLSLGGGKAVIMGDPDAIKSEDLLRAYGRAVESMHGRYITAEDVNTEVEDMEVVKEETDYVVGLSPEQGGLGDPSPVTAHGVLHGMKAALDHYAGDPSLEGVEVVVQGVGKVGEALTRMLVERDALVTVSDINTEKVAELEQELGVDAVAPDDVYTTQCDVFAPCALGGVINDDTVERLECDIVAGSANNVLDTREHADMLQEQDILYAPDYVINAGGLITVYHEMKEKTKEEAMEETEKIHGRLADIFDRAEQDALSTADAADAYAEDKMSDAKGKRFRTLGHDPILPR